VGIFKILLTPPQDSNILNTTEERGWEEVGLRGGVGCVAHACAATAPSGMPNDATVRVRGRVAVLEPVLQLAFGFPGSIVRETTPGSKRSALLFVRGIVHSITP